MQDSIVTQLSNVDFTNIARRSRLESLLGQVDKIIKGDYSAINRHMLGEMSDLGAFEQSFQVSKMNDLFGVDIISAGLTPETLRALAKNDLIFGAPAKEWWGRQSANMRKRFGDEMRQGFLLGESTQDLVRRVRGSATGARRLVEIGGKTKSVAVFSGGIMDVTTREAEALVRTSVNSMANATRLSTYVKNTDVIGSMMAQVTLDSRTSSICQSHGNRPDEWTLPDFEPIGGSNSFTGPPPWHFNCRSSLIPITKSWEELQSQGSASGATRQQRSIARKLDNNAPARVRASMNGQVPRNIGYDKWLKTQPKSVQIEALGPGRRKLWQQGKLNLTQTLDQTGRPLTLHQIGQLPANKPLPLKLPPRQPPVTIPRVPSRPAPPSSAPFIPPPTAGVVNVTLADMPGLQVGTVYRLNGEVFKVIKTGRRQMESVHFSTRTGKFVSARNRTVLKFGPKPPPVPPPRPPPGPTTTTAGAPRATFVDPSNYRSLKIGDIFKDGEGNVWKAVSISTRGVKSVPWSVKSGRFLAPRNGKVFGFTSAPAKTVKAFNTSTANAREALQNAFNRAPKFGTFIPPRLTPLLDRALNNAIGIMSKNGFNKGLADFLATSRLRVKVFDMGPWGRHIGLNGSSLGSRSAKWNGMMWSDARAIGMSASGSTPAATWIHEFGHHLDFNIARNRGGNFARGVLKGEAKTRLLELRKAHRTMLSEYKQASITVSQRVGQGSKPITARFQKSNWGLVQNNLKGVAQSSYSLHNEFEWFAEAHTHYFGLRGSRFYMQRFQPKTFAFFELLNSREMEILWRELA